MATLTLTCIADDRAGLVSDLSAPVRAHGANWTRSQMSRLGGKFAGILLIEVPDARADGLIADLRALAAQGLQVSVERTDAEVDGSADASTQRIALDVLGTDRQGIVAEISALCAARGFSIVEFASDVREAPMAGGHLFDAQIVLDVPAGGAVEDLRQALDAMADELMVDVTLSDV